MAEQGPTTRQRRLAAELQRLREAAGLTQVRAAELLGWERTKVIRIEGVKRIPSMKDVEAILAAYGGTDEAITLALLKLAKEVRQRGWWTPFGDVLRGSYAELEYAADRIRLWHVEVVPGLLQTEDYARTVIRTGVTDPEEIDRRVQVRVTRRAMLTRQHPPQLDILLAEEVLHRAVGGREVMRGQLATLLESGRREHVSIRVVPTAIGEYPSMGTGNVVLFEFKESTLALDVAYLETMAGGMYLEDISQVKACSVMFDRIAECALSEDDSAALIRTTLKET